MSARKLEWSGNPNVPRADLVVPVTQNEGEKESSDAAGGDGKLTKNQLKKLQKMKQVEEKKAAKALEKAQAKTAAPTEP
jgi:tryptophanyl-tRNA synthetase